MMNIQKWIVFSFLFFFLPLSLRGQENKDFLSSWDNKTLLQNVEKSYLSLESSQKNFEQARKLISSTQEVLSNVNKHLILQKEPEKEGLLVKAIRIKRLEERKKYYTALVKFLEEKKKFLEEKITYLEQLKKRLEEGEGQAQNLAKTLSAFQILSGEVESRLVKKSLPEGDSKKVLRDYSVKKILTERSELSKQIQEWEKEFKALPAQIQACQEEIKKGEKVTLDSSQKLQEILTQIQVVKTQENISKEFQEKEPAVLLALVPSMEIEKQKLEKDFQEDFKSVDANSKLRENYLKSEEILQKISPPNLEEIKIQFASKIPSVQNAEKALLVGETLLLYQKNRIARMMDYQKNLEDFSKELKEARESGEKYGKHLSRYLLLLEFLEKLQGEGKIKELGKLPKGADFFGIEENLENLQKTFKSIEEEMKRGGEKKLELAKSLEEAQKELQKKEQEIPVLKKDFEEEKNWAKWIEEVEKLPNPQLLERFRESQEKKRDLQNQIQSLEKKREEFYKIQEAITKDLENLENPLVTRSMKALERLQEEAKNRLRQIVEEKKFQVTLELSEEDSKKYREELRLVAQGFSNGTEKNITTLTLENRLEKQIDFISGMTNALERERELREKWGELGEKVLSFYKEKETLLKFSLQESRKSYGSALEMQLRLGRNQISSKDLPSGSSEASKRDSIRNLMEDLVGVRKVYNSAQNQVEENKSLLEKCIFKKKNLAERSQFLIRKLAQIRARDVLAREAEMDASKWTDIKKKEFERDIVQKIRGESNWIESLLSNFHSPEAEENFKLLEDYYQDLLKLEYKTKNLTRREDITLKLISLAREEKQFLKEILAVVSSSAEDISSSTALLQVQIESRLKPASYQESLLSRLDQKRKKTFVLEGEVKKEELPMYLAEGAKALFQSWIQDLSSSAWVQALEMEDSKLGLEQEIGGFYDDLAELKSKKNQMVPELTRLLGNSRESLKKLSPFEKPKDSREEYIYLHGKIGYTRKLQMNALIWAAVFSLSSLFLIPFLAIVLIRLANIIGNKIIHKVHQETNLLKKEREHRAETLVSVFKAVWTMVVVVVAGIYILKQFRIDITPIIASAGVVGLAIAFGAQTLIKDYFYGFFILLENQYVVGDIVQINEILGKVEKITLRLTILRSLDGTVHFLPNGNITQVSNKTKQYSRAVIDIGVSYNCDIDHVMEVLKKVGEDLKMDLSMVGKYLREYEVMGVEGFGDNSINLRMWFKTAAGGEQAVVARYVRKKIKEAFDREGIEIPFPQRVIHQAMEKKKEDKELK